MTALAIQLAAFASHHCAAAEPCCMVTAHFRSIGQEDLR